MNGSALALTAVLAVVCGVCLHQGTREWSRLRHLRRLAQFSPTQWGERVLLGHANHSEPSVPSEIQPLLEEFTEAWNAGSVGSRARVAACNQATAELNALMGFGVERRVRWRICLTVGVAGAAALIGVSASIAGVCLVCGAVSALLTWQIGRMADYRAQNLRAEWNGLIRRLRRSFPEK